MPVVYNLRNTAHHANCLNLGKSGTRWDPGTVARLGPQALKAGGYYRPRLTQGTWFMRYLADLELDMYRSPLKGRQG